MNDLKKGITEDGVKYVEYEIPDHQNVVEGLPIPTRTVKVYESLKNKRLEYETREEYQMRRKYNKYCDKRRGRPIWDSRLGTARKEMIEAMTERLYPTK